MSENESCPICSYDLEIREQYQTICLHNFHLECLRFWLLKDKQNKCPICRQTIDINNMDIVPKHINLLIY